jgi:hypothetical protein
MIAGNMIGAVEPSELTARIRAVIFMTVGLPIFATIDLAIFPSILPPVELPVFTSIFSTYIIGLGHNRLVSPTPPFMISAITTTTDGPRTTIQ